MTSHAQNTSSRAPSQSPNASGSFCIVVTLYHIHVHTANIGPINPENQITVLKSFTVQNLKTDRKSSISILGINPSYKYAPIRNCTLQKFFNQEGKRKAKKHHETTLNSYLSITANGLTIFWAIFREYSTTRI